MVWNMLYSSIYWEQESQVTHIFQRGWSTTNQWLMSVMWWLPFGSHLGTPKASQEVWPPPDGGSRSGPGGEWARFEDVPRLEILFWGFPWMGVPQNGWLISWKIQVKWMRTGGTPFFKEASIYRKMNQWLKTKSTAQYPILGYAINLVTMR